MLKLCRLHGVQYNQAAWQPYLEERFSKNWWEYERQEGRKFKRGGRNKATSLFRGDRVERTMGLRRVVDLSKPYMNHFLTT